MTGVSTQQVLQEADPLNLLSVETAVQRARDANLDGLVDVPIYFLSNFTISGVEAFVDFHGLSGGLNTQSHFGDYNVIHQPLMQSDSTLHAFTPKIIVLSLMYDVLAKAGVTGVCAQLQQLFDLAAAKSSATIVVNTFITPRHNDAAIAFDNTRAGGIDTANRFIRQFVKDNSAKFYLSDWDHYVQALGYDNAIDQRYWYMAKAPFKPAFLSHYASGIAKLSRALMGLSKKCLVLDCDGTLWGGVIGEEGMEGINLHPDDYPGNVFYDVQRTMLELRDRGVLLAINSKNNEQDVFDVLENHPHCLLHKEHFSALRINWDNKADNMSALAAELNLGLDSFVFLDDSTFECNLIQGRLPEVEVHQVPKRLYTYPDFADAVIDDCFFSPHLTGEDGTRAELYTARTKAEGTKANFDDINAYLRSLNITADIHEMHSAEIPRVAQLTNKTNQFNLAKTPYSESDIEGFHTSEDWSVYVMVVADQFGELGLTNVCIVDRTDKAAPFIDSLLMSCRVFERNLEYVFVDHIIKDVSKRFGTDTVLAQFKPSPKNVVAKSFYDKMGFEIKSTNDQLTTYVLDVSKYEPQTFDYIRRV